MASSPSQPYNLFSVFLGLPVCLVHRPSNKHIFTQSSSSSFPKICPYHCNLLCGTTFTMSSIPNCCCRYTQDRLSLMSHAHPSNHSHFCPKWCQFIFSVLCSHFHVAYNSVHMHHKPSCTVTSKHFNDEKDLNLSQPRWILTVIAATASLSTDNMSLR